RPGWGRPPAPPSVAPGLSGPVADLLSAVEATDARARASILAPAAEIEAAAAQATALLDEALSGSKDPALVERAAALEAQIEGMVDREALYSAAYTLAGAIDTALPELMSHRAQTARASSEGVGCDVAVQAGVLCIGGQGPNEYRGDFPLLIDLGGDDVHANSAGGASPLVNGLGASVTIDIGGNDTYATRAGTDTLMTGAQGAARTGGIGVLVDVTGNDRYSITAENPANSQLLGQGAAVAGVGILADGYGNDSYDIRSTMPSNATHAQGQGFSIIAAMALFIDSGGGNDSVRDEAAPVPYRDAQGVLHASRARAECCSSAVGGAVSLYADDGGTDSTTTLATASSPPDASLAAVPDQAVATSHGLAGLGGTAVSVTGTGATTRTTVAKSVGAMAGLATSSAYGTSALGGVSAAADAGGDDRYVMEGHSEAIDSLVLSDGCECARDVHATAGNANGNGNGIGVLGGASLSEDGGGTDSYILRGLSTAAATLEDRRAPETAAGQPGVSAETATGRTAGQGYGAAVGAGFLLDAAGDDRYESSTRSVATARWIPASGGQMGATLPVSGLAASEVQAAGFGDLSGSAPGYGELRDLGGNDTYIVDNTSQMSTGEPGSESAGEATTSAQASVVDNSVALLLDEGGTDSFSASPPDETCEGTRGTGQWRDCGTVFGSGLNR
ncbi:MAG TPA: hypothetical protein VG602_03170, partial [Actinomycetota bacterium]|nr:hypothetical protein [Actinomycetota bacterium]